MDESVQLGATSFMMFTEKYDEIGIIIPICSQFINEKGYSIDEAQMMTDHARRESVKRYASVQLDAKRRLLEGKQGRNL
jgi:hypothetical protein